MKAIALAMGTALFLVLWELAFQLLVAAGHWHLSELALYAGDKLGFAALLALVVTAGRRWRACGFAGPLALARWWMLWPIWFDALVPLSQGPAEDGALYLIGWGAVSLAVGFGEEGLFRGILMDMLGLDRPRRAIVVSSLLFGAIHLAGLLSPIDYRLVLAQSVSVVGLGMILGAVRIRAASIWPGLIVHAVLDFCGIAAGGGVVEAMQYSDDALYSMLGAGGVALAWGVLLCRRLPTPPPAIVMPVTA
ncbi:MAG TPA: CPBP family intramembrane glutamic endopeptidase [Aliidongia sp.]|uniref:CPBP family intramembrane glutamic endopeptidase n=1 Tax=Aliidongia sp. TaxID=1914230 RepID=UPI002DDDA6B9|nr:CPBP family intramembrane glutamic endopeptidase [Aliidongia sp.]HEV2677125.1 CPBP family intramembrane glutamic endopeptidase [Aliidongia sp.]